MADLPRHVVVALVFIRQGDSILLVRPGDDPQGYWGLPGGVMEAGESIDQAAIREVREETGLDVRLLRLVGVYSKPGEGSLAVAFEGEVLGGSLAPGAEIAECGWFPFDRLPGPVRGHLRQRLDDYRRGNAAAVWRRQ